MGAGMRCLSLASLCLVAACVDAGSDPTGATALTTASSDNKADTAATELRVRIDGLTVWMDPAAHLVMRDGQARWAIDGRASRNLTGVFSFVDDDVIGEAVLTGKRTFELTFGDDNEIATALGRRAIFLGLTPETGAAATAALWFAPRVVRAAGASSIYLHAGVEPVWIAGALAFRVAATLDSGWSGARATIDGGTARAMAVDDPRHVHLDLSFDAMKPVLASTAAPLHVSAVHGTTAAAKSAAVEARLSQLGLTRGDAYAVWPETCDPSVKSCLDALPDGTIDPSSCGDYRDVVACGALPVGPQP